MTNNEPHSVETIEKISRGNIGYRSKLGYKAPQDVLQRMSNGANREGTQELGLDITNQIFQDLYPDAEFIEIAHDYDFILNDKKVDVKGATLNKSNRWHFSLKNNQSADFFFFMLFDNIENYNLLRMFMIPSHEINHLTGVSISEGTMRKWDNWIIPMEF